MVQRFTIETTWIKSCKPLFLYLLNAPLACPPPFLKRVPVLILRVVALVGLVGPLPLLGRAVEADRLPDAAPFLPASDRWRPGLDEPMLGLLLPLDAAGSKPKGLARKASVRQAFLLEGRVRYLAPIVTDLVPHDGHSGKAHGLKPPIDDWKVRIGHRPLASRIRREDEIRLDPTLMKADEEGGRIYPDPVGHDERYFHSRPSSGAASRLLLQLHMRTTGYASGRALIIAKIALFQSLESTGSFTFLSSQTSTYVRPSPYLSVRVSLSPSSL